jgi:hypothetical protein
MSASREQQGLPPNVEDRAVLAAVVALLRQLGAKKR